MFRRYLFLLVMTFAFINKSFGLAENLKPNKDRRTIIEIDRSRMTLVKGKNVDAKSHYYSSANLFLGNSHLGQTISWGLAIHASDAFAHLTITSMSLSGSSDYTIVNNTCDNAVLGIGDICYYDVLFTPSSKDEITTTLTINSNFVSDDGYYNDTSTWDLFIYGSGFDLPARCSATATGSIISIDEQTLAENVPVVGTDLSLNYTSEYAPEYTSTRSKLIPAFSYNFEGWTNSLQHFYKPGQSRLFLGSGKVLEKSWTKTGGGNLLVANEEEGEVYIFSPAGKHLETRTFITGAVKYTFSYDSNDRLISISDSYGNITTFTRNTSGKLTAITAPHGQITTLTIGSNGLLASISNPKSEVHTMTYKSGTGLLETFTKPGGQVSTFTYDTNGKLSKDLGNGGDFWQLVLGTGGSITKSSNMSRTTNLSSTYDSNGTYTRTETSPFGFATSYVQAIGEDTFYSEPFGWHQISTTQDERYGSALRRRSSVVESINGVNKTTTFGQTVSYPSGVTPDPFNYSSITKTSTTNSKTTTVVFDNTTKTKTTTTPAGAIDYVTVDSYERPISVQTGSDTPTTLSYDLLGRLSSTIQGAYNQKTYAYNSAGFLQSVTNALSEVTSYAYDLAGRVTSVTLPDTRVIGYAYDANGNLTSVTPPSRPAHNFTFNAMELNSEYQPPTLSGVLNVNTQYSYNLDKQLTQITRPTGATAVFNYGSATGLLDSIALAGGSNAYTYQTNTDLVSRIDSADGIRTNYAYYGDTVSSVEERITSTNFLLGKVVTSFDSLHRPSSKYIQGNSSGTSYTANTVFNDDNMPTQIGYLYLTYSYPSGRLATTTMDTVSDSRTYDTYGNLSGYSAIYTPSGGGSPTALYSYTLTRDTLHRITTKSETIQGVTNVYTYSYDSAGRLTTVLKDGLAYSSYNYDSNGNRTSGVTAGVSFTATYDDQDRMLTYGGKTFSYNENGDRTQVLFPDTTTQVYTYDALGNAKTIKLQDGRITAYSYDGENRQAALHVDGVMQRRHIFENKYRIAARVNDSGVLNEIYFYGTRINTPEYLYKGGFRYRVITDHLGSPRLMVKTLDGTIAQRMDYNDLGGVTNDTNQGFQAYGYAGGIYLTFGKFVKFGARMYDPSTGRWLTKDPILFHGGDPNLYGYVLNDSINFIDPSGLFSEDYVAKRTTPNQQMGVGATMAGAGLLCMKMGAASLNVPMFLTGLGLGYEGGKNLVKARDRGAPDLSVLPK